MTVVGKSTTKPKPAVIPTSDVAPPVPPRPPRTPDAGEVPDDHPVLSRFPKTIGPAPFAFQLRRVHITERFTRRTSRANDAAAYAVASIGALFTGKSPPRAAPEVWWTRSRAVVTAWGMIEDPEVAIESEEEIPDALAESDGDGWAAFMKIVIATAEDDALERVKNLIDRGMAAEADDAKEEAET